MGNAGAQEGNLEAFLDLGFQQGLEWLALC